MANAPFFLKNTTAFIRQARAAQIKSTDMGKIPQQGV
jgi:hypothetical protein